MSSWLILTRRGERRQTPCPCGPGARRGAGRGSEGTGAREGIGLRRRVEEVSGCVAALGHRAQVWASGGFS